MQLITRSLTENQQAAIASLISHIGEFNFKISSLLKAVNASDTSAIHKQWIRWAVVDGRVDPIQLEHRNQELELFFK